MQINFKRPLMSINAACAALDCDHSTVIAKCESGDLWAFDLSLASNHRRDVRILVQSIFNLQAGRTAASRALSFPDVAGIIFPKPTLSRGVASLKACTVYVRLGIHPTHLAHLIKRRKISTIAGSVCRCGPGGSHRINFASLYQFLKTRRIS